MHESRHCHLIDATLTGVYFHPLIGLTGTGLIFVSLHDNTLAVMQ
jgi:hypothetical protein